MRTRVLAAVAALALGGAALTAAGPERRVGRADVAALKSEVGLTDEQAAQLKRLFQEERKASVRRNADLRIARMELEELLDAPTVDEAAVAARVKTMSELQAGALKARTERRLAVRRLLTPEQYQKLQQLQHQRRDVRARRARPARRPGRPDPDAPLAGAPSAPGLSDDEPAPEEPMR